MDWAIEIIKELGGADDDATRAFCVCYRNGDSLAALEAFAAKAEDKIALKGGESLYVFSDGSCYATWEHEIAKFGETVADFEDDWIEGLALKIHTVADLADHYGGGVIRNDRGSGSGGPSFVYEDDIKDPEIGEVEIDLVSRSADPEAWELAEDAAKALGLPQPSIVGVHDVDTNPGSPYLGLLYQEIYAV